MSVLAFPSTSITDSTSAGRSLLTAADAAAQKALLSVDDLVTLSGVSDGATNLGTFTGSTISDSVTIKAALQALETSLETKQATDAELTALAGLTSAADKVPYFTGSGTAAVNDFTAAGRSMVGAASAAAQTALLSAFVAAGGSAAKGLVPAPGSTARATWPHVLGDAGAFINMTPRYLGGSFVTTDQGTSSTSATDLTTVQSVSFTLDETSNVLALTFCNAYHTTSAAISLVSYSYDGSTATQTSLVSAPAANYLASLCGATLHSSVSSGSKTFKMQFSVASGTGNFRNRAYLLFLV